MKTVETHYNGNWIDKLLNSWPFCLHKESIRPVLRLTLGYTQVDEDGVRRWKWGDVLWGKGTQERPDPSLYRNGVIFFRFMLPFYVGFSIRWAGVDPTAKEYLQTGMGWKLNGRFTFTFRVQSDITSAEGTHGPNFDQSVGWAYGNK
jgi:hypothetical protein